MSVKQNEQLVSQLQSFNQDLVESFRVVQNWVHGILPDEKLVLDSDESTIRGADGVVTLETGIIPVKTIGGVKETPGYVVIRWSANNEGDVDGSCVGQHLHLYQASKCFIKALFEEKLDRYYESMDSAAFERELGMLDF